jgi:hypothetical protein
MSKVIDEAIKKNNPTDGAMNTKDILYVVENEFKKELSSAMSTVMINKGKSLVKLTAGTPEKKKKRKGETKPGEPKTQVRKPVKRVKPQPAPAAGIGSDRSRCG